MKKGIQTISLLYIALLIFSIPALAKEEVAFRYFGVNATLSQSEEQTVQQVQPNGKGANEGFVFTGKTTGGEKVHVEVDLKGSNTVYLKIEETDARGTYIKETVSKPYRLTEDWQTALLDTTLSPNTKQVDYMVLTVEQNKTPFSFQNVKVDLNE